MKNFALFSMLALTLGLTACANTTGTTTGTTGTTVANGLNTATNIGTNVFKFAVDQKCRTELQANNAWRLLAATMTATKQSEMETSICGCVSEKAPQSVTVVELTQAATDPTARTKIVANAVAKTFSACYGEIVK